MHFRHHHLINIISMCRCRRQGSQQNSITPQASSQASNTELVPDAAFSLAKISFGDILTPVGIFLMVFGFGAYFQLIPGADVSGVALIYGFPMLLLGFALKYAQLEPVPCETTRAAYEARDTQMTDNQKQVREDCTRYRCADPGTCSALCLCLHSCCMRCTLLRMHMSALQACGAPPRAASERNVSAVGCNASTVAKSGKAQGGQHRLTQQASECQHSLEASTRAV